MNKTTTHLLPIVLAMGFAVASPAMVKAQESAAPTASTAAVSVELGDFDTMRETRYLRGVQRRDTERSIQALATWLTKRAEAVLPSGQHLEIVLDDVDLAGEYIPGGRVDMQNVRVVKDIYAPRIELSWRLDDASGTRIDEGKAVLTDIAFLSSRPIANDPLRYEKRMLGDWLRKQFPK